MKTEKISVNQNGGARRGAGRKKGSPNIATREAQKKAKETGITPLEYMLSVMRDENADPRSRQSMAQAAAPYVHAKLSSIELTGKDGGAVETVSKIELVALK